MNTHTSASAQALDGGVTACREPVLKRNAREKNGFPFSDSDIPVRCHFRVLQENYFIPHEINLIAFTSFFKIMRHNDLHGRSPVRNFR